MKNIRPGPEQAISAPQAISILSAPHNS